MADEKNNKYRDVIYFTHRTEKARKANRPYRVMTDQHASPRVWSKSGKPVTLGLPKELCDEIAEYLNTPKESGDKK